MNVRGSFFDALESLAANKLRSGLTVLGIVIGVAAVIAMLGIGTGTEAIITDQIESIGTNLLYVTSGGEADNPEPLTLEDAEAISDPRRAPDVATVAPVVQGRVQVSLPGASSEVSLSGVTPGYFDVQTADLAEGREINQEDLDTFSPVVLLGWQTAIDLYGRSENLTGESIRVNDQIFQVAGVLAQQGGTGLGSSDDRILVPLTTAQMRLLPRSNGGEVNLIYVQAAGSEVVSQAEDQVIAILRSRHLSNLGEDDFEILSTQMLLDTASTITGTITAFLGGIAAISLLVGGIGIMNIMLVSVVERTREIGLRKALGARKRDILIQFLVESSLLSLGGGVIGILTGYGIAVLIGQLASLGGTPINPVITGSSILMATLFSAAVGLFFGLYPANRAAGLEPVEALRTE